MGTHHLETRSITEKLHTTVTTMNLLRRMRGQICPATRAWTSFLSPGGGIEFFRTLEDRVSTVSIRDIKKALDKLVELESVLLSMSDSWQESATIVSLQRYLRYKSNSDLA